MIKELAQKKTYKGVVVVSFTTNKKYLKGDKYETQCEFSFDHLKNNKKYIK